MTIDKDDAGCQKAARTYMIEGVRNIQDMSEIKNIDFATLNGTLNGILNEKQKKCLISLLPCLELRLRSLLTSLQFLATR